MEQKAIGAAAVFVLWLKLFYFLRLFKPTSAFISMIIEMFIDIKIFFLIFFIGVLAFANTYYVLDMGNTEQISGDNYVKSVIYAYMQGLGEFGVDDFDKVHLSPFYWTLFLISTMFI